MSIWGKIFGATAGFAVGGPMGALVGGIAGHVIDKRRSQKSADSDGSKQVAFTIAVIALGAKMAKADGVVTANEVRAFKEVFHIPPEEMKNVGRVFDQARKDTLGYEVYAQQVASLFKSNPKVLEDLLDGLFHIAKADNVLHPDEILFLENVAFIFGFDKQQFLRIKEGHMNPNLINPYTILGVDPDSTDEEIKTSYRKLIKENHPDTLIAQGVPEEFIKVANEKLAVINDAYDRIEKLKQTNKD
ncbi:TerB family tellurite resistance protein [Alphaproteobacteria bacterium]|nr:TerB family tellurite resistance protein [Alphaproteobacteria bacterium]